MARPMYLGYNGTSARERYEDVAANLFEVESERDFELFKKQCLTFVKAGNLSKLRVLISDWKKSKKVPSLNFRDEETGNTPVILAASQKDKKMLQLLLEQDVDLTLRNKERKSAVHLACNDLQMMMLSGKLKADLYHAAWQGNVSAVKEVLKRKSNINERNSEGMTPLSLATRDINFFENLPQMTDYDPLKVVKVLLDKNADISLEDINGRTTMHHLVENIGLTARGITRHLLGRTKRLDAVDSREMTPLHTAAKLGDLKIVEMLLRSGACVSSRSSDGRTPLHFSVINGKEKVSRLLMKWSADRDAADDKGFTPLDIAHSQKNKSLLEVLLQTATEDSASSEDEDISPASAKETPRAPSGSVQPSETTLTRKKLPSLRLSLKQRQATEQHQKMPPNEGKVAVESTHGFKLPNLEFHAMPSMYSPVVSSSRAKSAKKSSSLPNSFKFESTNESHIEGETSLGASIKPSLSEISTSQFDNLLKKSPVDTGLNMLTTTQPVSSTRREFKSNLSARGNDGHSTLSSSDGETSSSFVKQEQFLQSNHATQVSAMNDCGTTGKKKFGHTDEIRTIGTENDSQMISRNFEERSGAEERRDPSAVLAVKAAVRRQANSFEARKLSAKGPGVRALKSGRKEARLAPDFKEDLNESRELLDPSSADTKESSLTDASLPALQTIVLELQDSPLGNVESRCSSSIRRTRQSLITPCGLSSVSNASSFSSTSVSPSLEHSKQPERDASKSPGSSVPLGTERDDENECSIRANLELVCDKLMQLDNSKRSSVDLDTFQTTGINSSVDLDRCESKMDCRSPKIETTSFGSTDLRDLKHVRPSSSLRLVPPLATKSTNNSTKKSNRVDTLSVDGKNLVRKATQQANQQIEDGNRPVEANLIHVSLPNIKLSVLKRSLPKQLTDENQKNLSKCKGKPLGRNNTAGKRPDKGTCEESEFTSDSKWIDFNEKDIPSISLHRCTSIDLNSRNDSGWEDRSSQTPQECSDLPVRCSESPQPSSSNCSRKNSKEHLQALDTAEAIITRQLLPQLSVVQELPYESGVDISNNKSVGSSPAGSSLDSSLNLSVTLDIGDSTVSDEAETNVNEKNKSSDYDLEKKYGPCENIDVCIDQLHRTPASANNVDYFKEMTEIAFAPGVNSAISNVPSQLISRRNSLVRSSICTQTSIEESDCCEEELHGWLKGAAIDKGAYGTVYLGMTNSGKLVAVKEVELNRNNEEEAEVEYRKLQQEIEMLKSLTHRYIVKFIGTIMQENVIDIFMEYIPGGSLALTLKRFGNLSEKVFRRFTRQMISAVVYIHDKGIVHRDIKGANIMLTSGGVVKLIDFGCAKQLTYSLGSNTGQLKSCQGTPYWMAPEVIRGIAYGLESDIWSVGCTVFEMATGKPPWTGCKFAAMYAIATNESPIPKLPIQFSQDARNFVASCLIRDQSQRATAKQLMKHRFMKYKSFSRAKKITNCH